VANAFNSFTVRFTPGSTGFRTGTVIIANTDGNESPYVYGIQGVGLAPTSNVSISGNNIPISNGDYVPAVADYTDFGNAVSPTGWVDKVFVITNTGDSTLYLTSDISFGGANSGNFTLQIAPGVTNISPNASTPFTVRFMPDALGLRTGTVIVANNDPDDDPYIYGVQGTGIGLDSEIELLGNGNTITNNDFWPTGSDLTDFGTYLTNGLTGTTNTFVITNTGSANLVLSNATAITLTGDPDFSLVSDAGSSDISSASFTDFKIGFDPTASGTRTGVVTIVNNDPDENPYVFHIKGIGQDALPEIAIFGNGYLINDNEVVPSDAAGSDLGDVAFTGTSSNISVFVITNTGTGGLTLGGSPKVNITGTHFADFDVITNASSPVTAGGFTTFPISFTPGGMGKRSATVTIDNNDSNESSYDFAIEGYGQLGHRILYNQSCNDCHANHTNDNYLVTGAEQEARCKSCHTPGGVASNAAGMVLHTNSTGTLLADCGTCHEVHSGAGFNALITTNIGHGATVVGTNLFFIRGNINHSDYFPTAEGPLVFHSTNAYTFTNAPFIGVCQACHTTTKYARNYDIGGSNFWDHNVGTPCSDCHSHDAAFAPAGGNDCLGCHGGDVKGSRRAVSADFSKTSHHIPGTPDNSDCKVCHYEAWDTSITYHKNGLIDLIDPDLGTKAT
jgi:hypothetical protein